MLAIKSGAVPATVNTATVSAFYHFCQARGRCRYAGVSQDTGQVNKFIAFGIKSCTMKKSNVRIFFFLLFLFQACSTDEASRDNDSNSALEPGRYATLFQVTTYKGHPLLKLPDPWHAGKPPQRILLVPRHKERPRELPEDILVISTPVKRVTVMSGTHIAFLDQLGAIDKIAGVGRFGLIKNQQLNKRIEAGKVREIGTSGAYKQEQLLAVDPQVAFMTPYQDQSVQNLRQIGIPVIPVADYLEKHPLGRAEWLRFMSYFFHKQEQADSIFHSTAENYRTLSRRYDTIQHKPSIFSGKPYGGIWYQPGGKSYMAQLLEDAGANYLWSGKEAAGGLPLDFETVYAKAAEADFWRLVVKSSHPYTYDRLLEEDPRYADFKAFTQKQVIVCNVADALYYEVAPTRPDVVLADLIHLLHPGALPNHEPVYYKRMQP